MRSQESGVRSQESEVRSQELEGSVIEGSFVAGWNDSGSLPYTDCRLTLELVHSPATEGELL